VDEWVGAGRGEDWEDRDGEGQACHDLELSIWKSH
jgi:hypothetical protein